jgi:hypothetical protein
MITTGYEPGVASLRNLTQFTEHRYPTGISKPNKSLRTAEMEADLGIEKVRIQHLTGPNYRPWSIQAQRVGFIFRKCPFALCLK